MFPKPNNINEFLPHNWKLLARFQKPHDLQDCTTTAAAATAASELHANFDMMI
jgi:hypothetical protein